MFMPGPEQDWADRAVVSTFAVGGDGDGEAAGGGEDAAAGDGVLDGGVELGVLEVVVEVLDGELAGA